MVGEQGPGKTFHAGFNQQGKKSVCKQGAVVVVKEDNPTLYASHDHMPEQAGHANSGDSWHEQNISEMDMLEEDFGTGHINKEEYLKRKNQISMGSIIY